MKERYKCFACGAEGHFARDCTANPTVNNVTMVKETTNPYLKRGKINGVEMTVLLDTGSYYTLLKSSIASQCKLKLRKTKKSLYGLGSVSVPSVSAVGKVDTMITVDDVEAGPVKVLVVPEGVQRYDMIIGRNWLDLDAVTYRKEEGKLILLRTKDDIGLGDVSVVTIGNELDTLQVLTAVPGQGRRALKTEDFKYVNTDVSSEEQTELLSLVNEFRDCFALGIEELGCTKKEVMFEWSSPQEVAFSEMKKVFANAPIFCMFDPKAAVTEVHTDASSIGLGAMLLQSKEEGKPLQMVYCISKKLGVAESHYHSSKLELMSIVWAVDRWRHFLLGIRFSIITDCQALVYLRGHRATKPQVMRWYDILQEYDFDIHHRPGTKMQHVDALSRDPARIKKATHWMKYWQVDWMCVFHWRRRTRCGWFNMWTRSCVGSVIFCKNLWSRGQRQKKDWCMNTVWKEDYCIGGTKVVYCL